MFTEPCMNDSVVGKSENSCYLIRGAGTVEPGAVQFSGFHHNLLVETIPSNDTATRVTR